MGGSWVSSDVFTVEVAAVCDCQAVLIDPGLNAEYYPEINELTTSYVYTGLISPFTAPSGCSSCTPVSYSIH